MANTIRIGYDVADVKTGAEQLTQLLEAQNNSLRNFTVAMAQSNAQGKIIGGTLQRLEADGKKLTATFEVAGNTMHIMGTRVSESAASLEKARKAASELANVPITQSITDKLLGQVSSADLSTKLQSRLATVQAGLNKALTVSDLSRTEVDRLFDDMNKGLIKIETGGARNVQKAMLDVKKTVEDINKELARTNATKTAQTQGAATGVGVGAAARELFPLPSQATTASILTYNRAIQQLQIEVAKAALPTAHLNDLLKAAAGSPQRFAAGIATLAPNAQAVATAIANVSAASDRAGNTGASAAQRMLVAWQGLLRILEVQVFRRTINALLNALREGITQSLDFQVKLQQVAAVGSQSGAGIAQLEQNVRRLSEAYAIPQAQVLASAQTALTDQLGNSTQAMQTLENATRLATATGIDLQSSTRLVTTTLDAFGLSATHAGRVTDILFQASQRTRVPLNEMQAAIGRVGISARALNLDIEQVTAAFLTIAQQGGRPTEAFSLLNQVLNRLQSPAKEVRDLLTGWGTPTAQAAFSTFGFFGVLNKLNQELEKSPERLGEIAGSVRSLRGILSLTGDQTANLTTNFQQLTAGTRTVSDALNNVVTTPAHRIQETFQSIKNYFTNDIGKAVTETIVSLVDKLGGAQVAFSSLVNAVRVAATVVISYKVASTLLNTTLSTNIAVTNLQAQALLTTGREISAATARTILFRNALATIGPAVALTALVAGITAYNAYLDEIENRRKAAIERLNNETREANRKTTEENNRAAQTDIASYRQRLEDGTQAVRQAFAENVRLSRINRDEVIQHQKEQVDAFRLTGQQYLDTLRERLNETRKSIREATEDIKTSRTRIASFTEQRQASQFQTRLGFEQDPFAAIRLIQQRRAQIEQEAQTLIARGDRASVEAGRQRFQESIRLLDEETRKRVEIQRTNFEIAVQEGRVQPQLDAFGRQRYVLRLNLNAAQQEGLRLQQLEEQAERRLIQFNEERVRQAKANEEKEKTRLETVSLALRRLTEFQIFDPTGKLANQFQRIESIQGRPAALQAASQEFERRVQTLQTAIGPDIQTQTALLQSIFIFRSSLQQQVAAQERLDNDETHQRKLNQLLEEAQRRQKLAREQLAESQAEGGVFRTRAAEATRALQGSFGPQQFGGGLFDTTSGQERRERAARIEEIQSQMEAAARSVTRATDRTTADEAQRVFDSLKAALQRFQQEHVAGVMEAVVSASGRTIASQLTYIQQQLEAARARITAQEGAQARLVEAEQVLQRITNNAAGAAGKFNEINTAIKQNNTDLVSGMDRYNERLVITRQSLEDISVLLGGLNRLPQVQVVPVRPGQYLGGMQYFAQGGYGPKGTDRLLAWVSPGEFIVNARQTQRFYTQLLAINSGHQPKYYAQGGPVSVGDININYSGTGSNDTDVREIGRLLQREIRRGTISFRGS